MVTSVLPVMVLGSLVIRDNSGGVRVSVVTSVLPVMVLGSLVIRDKYSLINLR